jgi:hypothetical protein
MSDYGYDQNNFDYNPAEAMADSYEWQQLSDQSWDVSIDMRQIGDEFWVPGETETANEFYQLQYQFEDLADQAYEQSWEAFYGPVNAEGYTAYDASMGYTTQDTSFIEPASSAASCSMISDNSMQSTL